MLSGGSQRRPPATVFKHVQTRPPRNILQTSLSNYEKRNLGLDALQLPSPSISRARSTGQHFIFKNMHKY